MGTLMVCIYATLFFAYFEQKHIWTKYKANICFYRCQIDDIFCVWVEDPKNPNEFDQFKKDSNGYCKLD